MEKTVPARVPTRVENRALRIRLISVIALLPILVLLLALGGYVWLVTVLLVGVLAGRELYILMLMGRANHAPNMPLGLALIVLLILEAYWPSLGALRPLWVAGLLITLLYALTRRDGDSVAGWALTVAGAAYVGGLLGHFVALRQMDSGLWWLVLGLSAVWLGDGAAYLVGSHWGRNALCPRISPKKTWEGAVGGFAGCILGAIVCVAICRQWAPASAVAHLAWWRAALLGAILGPLALMGDLVVSMFKRAAGAKDSGALIPGHGGMLDRADSLLLAIPIVYYWALFLR